MNRTEVSSLKPELVEFSPEAIRAYVEARAAMEAARGRKVSVVCGAIVEEGEPTGSLNLHVRQEIIRAMAAALRERR